MQYYRATTTYGKEGGILTRGRRTDATLAARAYLGNKVAVAGDDETGVALVIP